MPTNNASQQKPVAITGVGLATSLGLDCATTWSNICAGKSGIRKLTALEQQPVVNKGGGQAVDLPADYHPQLAREARYLRHTIDQALAAAGIDPEALPYPSARIGILLGTTLHGMRAAGQFIREKNVDRLSAFLAPAAISAATDARFTGALAATTCSACSSGLAAINLAVSMLRSRKLDMVIAGGYDVISEYAYAGFESLRLVADGPLRPFCIDRDGMKLGEGFGIVVLERPEDAKSRGAHAVANVVGCGESADAHHLTQPHPGGMGASNAIARALCDAGLKPDSIDLVAAHATSTPDNDVGEYAALKHALGDKLATTPVAALKSMLGHTLGGAGAVELIIAAMALRDGVVPPTINVTPETTEYEHLQLHPKAVAGCDLKRSMNLSIGFGGANACVVLARPDVADSTPEAPNISRNLPGRVCVTGVGTVLPGNADNARFAAEMSTSKVARLSQDSEQVDAAWLSKLLEGLAVRRLSEYARLTVASARLACSDADLLERSDLLCEASALLGSCHGSADYSERYYRELVDKGLESGNPMLFAEGVPNAGAAHLTIMLGLQGGSQTIIGSRTSALEALNLASVRIEAGEASRIIINAAEENVAVIRDSYAQCNLRGTPGRISQPLGDESGFLCGSGAVSLVLESEAAAASRGALPLGYITGGYHALFAANDRRRAVKLMRSIYEQAGRPEYVISSANNTWVDRAEAISLAGTNATVGAMYGHLAETFSVMPLAALASVFLTGRMPALLLPDSEYLRGISAATGQEEPSAFSVLCTDYLGAVAATSVELVPEHVRQHRNRKQEVSA